MKTVIMISYSFPPEGQAGVYRVLRFVRHLSRAEWKVKVISAVVKQYERYDPDLLAEIPRETEVARIPFCDPWQAIQSWRNQKMKETLSGVTSETIQEVRRVQNRSLRTNVRECIRQVEAWCYHPDMAMSWIRPAVKAIKAVCAQDQPHVIWATAGPVSAFRVAEQASRSLGIPYVLDFRDAWTLTANDFEDRRPSWAKRADRRNMYRVLKGAQAVVFLYDTMAEAYCRAYKGALESSRVHILPNGYEGSIDEYVEFQHEKCTIFYGGTLSSYRFDSLLEALCYLKDEDQVRASKLKFCFVGEGMQVLEDEAAARGLTDFIETKPPVSLTEITRLQREADALLLLGRPSTMRGYELFASAKLFGYLKTGKPIIGVLPTDESQKILHRVGSSTVADFDSPAEIVAVIQRVVDAWETGALSSLRPDREVCESYSMERQVFTLARALEGVTPVKPFVPGSVDPPPSLQEFIGRAAFV